MKKRGAKLGQHFLKARWAAHAVAAASDAKKGEVVLEIGPGTGALTNELLRTGTQVIAIEKDPTLVERLKDKFSNEIHSGQLTLIKDDIRTFISRGLLDKVLGNKEYVVAANIPYYITGEIIRSFLTAKHQPKRMTLLIQKEVAERIAKSKKESIMSLSVKAYGTPRYVKTVGKECFSPPPRVDSAILAVENISRNFFITIDEKKFFEVIKAGFASKRKLLASNLSVLANKNEILAAFKTCDIPDKARAEDVPLKQWRCLASKL